MPKAVRQPSNSVLKRAAIRKEVVQLALRDTLARAKLPSDWVRAELLPVIRRSARSHQVHLQLLLRRWDDRPVQGIVEVEQGLLRRMKLLDSTAGEWVCDVSWRFALVRPGDDAEWASTQFSGNAAESAAVSSASQRENLLDPERERRHGSRKHPDFSPTQPLP